MRPGMREEAAAGPGPGSPRTPLGAEEIRRLEQFGEGWGRKVKEGGAQPGR